MLLAVILRISLLGAKSLWLDEGQATYRATLPLLSLAHVVTHGQMNMSAYYLMLHMWTKVAGTTEFMLRLPSVFFDVATVALTYALGAELGKRRAGLVAALFVTINVSMISHAQMVRSYAMLAAFATAGAVFFIRALKRSSQSELAGYFVCVTGSVYLHLFGILALPAQWASLVLLRADRKTAIRLTLCMCAIAVFAAPAFILAIRGDHGNVDWIQPVSLSQTVGLLVFFAGSFKEQFTVVGSLLATLYLIGIALAIASAQESDRFPARYLLVSLILPIVLTITISLQKPLLEYRYLIAEVPLFVLLAAVGFDRMKPLLMIIAILAIALSSLQQDYLYYKAPSGQDWRAAIDFVARHAQPKDELVVYPGFFNHTVQYYIDRTGNPETFPLMIPEMPVAGLPGVVDKLLAASGHHADGHRVWLTYHGTQSLPRNDPEGTALPPGVAEKSHFNGVRLFLFEGIAGDYRVL